jgi:hypothetical protein
MMCEHWKICQRFVDFFILFCFDLSPLLRVQVNRAVLGKAHEVERKN